jgi:hypothetical protein
MKAKGLDAFVLRRNPNLAWAIAGRAHVPTTIDMACFDLIITHDSATAITNVVEAPRLIAEELPSEVSVKTIQRSYNNRLGSGHLGFACYDQFFNFIDLRNCGGVGNTTLSRPLNAGDSFIYVNSVSGWSTDAVNSFFRHILIFPATHPYYSTPHYYTRIGFGDFSICHANTFTLTAQGDYEVRIQNTSNVNITMPNIGYATPAGTPISVGLAGGSYNYALGAPDYPETWTTYTTPPFTGENRNSVYPFRQATKYIQFLNLVNYNYRTETAGNSARYLIDNILMVQCPNNSALPSSFFNRTTVL